MRSGSLQSIRHVYQLIIIKHHFTKTVLQIIFQSSWIAVSCVGVRNPFRILKLGCAERWCLSRRWQMLWLPLTVEHRRNWEPRLCPGTSRYRYWQFSDKSEDKLLIFNLCGAAANLVSSLLVCHYETSCIVFVTCDMKLLLWKSDSLLLGSEVL